MYADFLLDAVGLIDDDLILDAETCPAARRAAPLLLVRRWAALAACLALVIALGYRASQLGTAGGSSGASNGASTSSGGGTAGNETTGGSPSSGTEESGDYPAAIMVDGVLYWSTDEILAGEVDPSIIRDTTSYTTDGMPEEDGQTNFAREGTQYAVTADGVAVLVGHEWVLFEPAPSWAQEG